MDPAKTMTPAPWMRADETTALLDALGADLALFVGGCVRDWLLGRAVGDIDLATPLAPRAVQDKLAAAHITCIPTGIDHGTLTAVISGRPFEITTLRRDVQTDGRRAVVAYSTDWAEDAARRDFTINTLLADANGRLFDPLGQGLADLTHKTLRFVGDPAARIAEDYLRILRYFRFAAQLGWALDDEAALQACRAAAPRITDLSKERITQEIMKLLATDNPVPVLSLMQDNDILPGLLQDRDLSIMERLTSRHPLTRLSLLRDPQAALVLSNAQKKWLETLESGLQKFQDDSETAIKKRIYHHGNKMAAELYALWCAHNKKEPQAALLSLVQDWRAPVFPVTGEDLIREGFTPGPDLGAELKRREDAWLETLIS